MSKLTAEKKRKFLELLAELGNATHAAEGIDVTRQCLYNARKNDPEFAEAWGAAHDLGNESLEDIARQRAKDGSDTLLIFLLKGARPEKYRERFEANVTGNLTIEVVEDPKDPDTE